MCTYPPDLRFAYCAEQVRTKPGRQVVTFLLVCNLSMWAINTLETNRADSHPIQVSSDQLTVEADSDEWQHFYSRK